MTKISFMETLTLGDLFSRFSLVYSYDLLADYMLPLLYTSIFCFYKNSCIKCSHRASVFTENNFFVICKNTHPFVPSVLFKGRTLNHLYL